ncbi:MAG: SpoIID/LytB domain-containing protein [Lachnospiraceae bacterium]|nr:SpoIID/LytB domain-containing protein [Lachnospiraceae bacterium]
MAFFTLHCDVEAMDLSKYLVRIGLVSKYSGHTYETMKNHDLVVGYWVNGTFTPVANLYSELGFKVAIDDVVPYVSNQSYASLEAAQNAKKELIAKTGYSNLYAGMRGYGDYHVYISGSELSTEASEASAIEAQTGMGFQVSTAQSRYTTRLYYTEELIIEVGNDGQYPNFYAASCDAAGVSVIDLGERKYRGFMEIGRYGGSSYVTCVNVLPMEEYLYGVVPCEMSSSWEAEALKAQAVVARSYAYASNDYTGSFGLHKGYALVDTTSSQVYRGYGAENTSTNAAVDATAGVMVWYRTSVVKAYFYSTSGGHTEAAENVWDVALTYYRAMPDETEDYAEKKPWIKSYTAQELARIMADQGVNVGSVTDVSVPIRTDAGRIYQLRIRGSVGEGSLYKEKVRTALGLPDSKAKVIAYGDVPDEVMIQGSSEAIKGRISSSYVISGEGEVSAFSSELEQYVVISKDNLTNFPKNAPSTEGTYYFAGMGYGHGVGLSQSGARALARDGYDYKSILLHYYSQVSVY